jgi:hypothetical protein
LELSTLKGLSIQMASFLGSADGRRAGLVEKVWIGTQHLARRFYELTGRSHWEFGERYRSRPQDVHEKCAAEVDRVLRGTPDKFDLMNQSPAPVNLFTSNTRCVV